MSYIMETIKCEHCGYEMNTATGTFGGGYPNKCPKCGDTKFRVISAGWNAQVPPDATEQTLK